MLQNDKRAIFSAAAHAQKAVDFLHGFPNPRRKRAIWREPCQCLVNRLATVKQAVINELNGSDLSCLWIAFPKANTDIRLRSRALLVRVDSKLPFTCHL